MSTPVNRRQGTRGQRRRRQLGFGDLNEDPSPVERRLSVDGGIISQEIATSLSASRRRSDLGVISVPALETPRYPKRFLDKVALSCNRFPLLLYITLIFRSLLPTIYNTLRVYWIGNLPNTGAVSIAAQMQWVDLILEVFQEAVRIPLFFCVGRTLYEPSATRNKTKTGFLLGGAVYSVFVFVVFCAASPLTRWMGNSDPETFDSTVAYIRLELVGRVFYFFATILVTLMVMVKSTLALSLLILFQLVVAVLCDLIFLSGLVGLEMGIAGAGWSSIVSNLFFFIFSMIFVILGMEFSISDFTSSYDFAWIKEMWLKLAGWTVLESAVRNLVYMFVVVRAMNLLDSQDSYWITNTFYWSWLLLPANPLFEVLRQDVANENQPVSYHIPKLLIYLIISVGIYILWLVTIPLWWPFMHYVLKADDYLVFELALILLPGYIAFVIGALLGSVFSGGGRPDLTFYSTAIGNLIICCLWGAFLGGALPNTVEMVAGIFSIGLILSVFTNLAMYPNFLRYHRVI